MPNNKDIDWWFDRIPSGVCDYFQKMVIKLEEKFKEEKSYDESKLSFELFTTSNK
jgi:hypothetical protein